MPGGGDHSSRFPGPQLYRPEPGGETFHITTVETGDELGDFCRRAKAESAAQSTFITNGPWDEDQLVYFSCTPWFPVTALTNERNADPSDSVPRASWGRYEEKNGRTILLLSLELNHRLLDGVHVGKLFDALNAFLEAL